MSSKLYVSNRARLRSAATLTPYQKTKKWMTQYGIVTIMTILLCFLWCGFVLFCSQLVLFFGGHYFFRFWDEEEERINAFTIYDHPVTLWVRIAGLILIIILMIRRQKKRQKR